MEKTYLPGQIAKKTGINKETLRFYEKKGLLSEPLRSQSGYRQYPEETIQRIHFIQNAKKLGFTLKEIGELLLISLTTKRQCQNVKKEIDRKLFDVDEKIKALQILRRAIKALQIKCSEGGMQGSCPILWFLRGGDRNDTG